MAAPIPDIQDYVAITWATLADVSRDGRQVLIQLNTTGTFQLYEVRPGGGPMRQLTGFDEPVRGRYLGDGRLVIEIATGGNERGQIHVYHPTTGVMVPVAVDQRYVHNLGGVDPARGWIAFVSNRRNGVDFDVYLNEAESGQERCIYQGGGWCSSPTLSPDGRFAVTTRLGKRALDSDLVVSDLQSGQWHVVARKADPAIFERPSWRPDSSGFFFSCNQERDLLGIAAYELASRSWEYVLTPPWDATCALSRDGSRLFLITNQAGVDHCQIHDSESLQPIGNLPQSGVGVLGSFGGGEGGYDGLDCVDGRHVVVGWESPTEPHRVEMVDLETGATTVLASGVSAVAPMVEPERHQVRSFDGTMIQALVFRPSATQQGLTPVVVFVHGGPESQTRSTFAPIIQYLVARGYAVVAPNVRGSTGFGKRFAALDDGRLRLDSVKDLAAIHGWLDSVGLDPARAALYGGSYGGYMVLAGLAFQPTLWAAGVDIVGISNLVTFLENTAPYRRAYREPEYGYLATDRDFLTAASPLTHADSIAVPLLIIHGANDPRVPLAEAEQLATVLQARGVRCDLLVYADEGHGLAKLKNRLDAFPRIASFLDGILGGPALLAPTEPVEGLENALS